MCGGTVDVFVHELSDEGRGVCAEAFAAAVAGQSAGIATLLDGPAPGAKLAVIEDRVLGGLHGPELLDHSVTRDLTALSERGTSALRHYGDSGAALGSGVSVHLQAFRPPPQLILIGAIDYSAAVAALARQAGYEVLIADAREAFARSERFSRVATVHVGWPAPAIDERELGPRDAVIVFSHDSKFDEPATAGRAAQRRRLHRCARQPSHRARSPPTSARRRCHRGGAAAGALAVWPRHRRRDPGGGRDLDHGRGDRRTLRPRRAPADHDR